MHRNGRPPGRPARRRAAHADREEKPMPDLQAYIPEVLQALEVLRLGDGRVLVAGGLAPGVTFPSVEIFQPASSDSGEKGVWTLLPRAVPIPSGAAAVLLADGRALFVGGLAGGRSAEIFDPDL